MRIEGTGNLGTDTDPPAAAADADRDAKALYDATEGGLTGWGTDEDAVFRTLEGKSTGEIDLIRRSYRDHYGKDLDQVLRDETSGDDRDRVDRLLRGSTGPGQSKPEGPKRDHSPAAEAARLKDAMDGLGTDEDALRDVLRNKSKAEIDTLARTYHDRYGDDLRGRLVSELGGRDEVEIVDQMFDLGSIDARDPGAGAERLRRLQQLQDVEQGAGSWVTGKIQQAVKGESDEQRLNRNVERARLAMGAGDSARAGQLLGFAEGDLDSFRTAKDTAAETAATGAALVASTAVVIGTAGAATPLVVAAYAGAAGAAASGGAYAIMEGDAADPADIARQVAIGGATGATAGIGSGVGVAEQAASTSLRQAAINGARVGVRAGAAGGAADGAVRTATERETWREGVASGLGKVGKGAVVGAATGAVVGGVTGAAAGVGRNALARAKIVPRLRAQAAEIRQTALNGKPAGKGNVSVGQAHLDDGVLLESSGTSRRAGQAPRPRPLSEGGQFEPTVDSHSGRVMDTDPEYKVLSDLAEQLERRYPDGTTPRGKVFLYSEMDLCQSCQSVKAQFEAKFPNIEVEVTYDHSYPFPKE